MKPQELVNRTVNLVATTLLVLSGFAFVSETFLEPEVSFKVDEILLFWLGVGILGWYLWGKNKWHRSIVPILAVWLGFSFKIMAVVVEVKDKNDVGDDMGALVLFLLASLLVTYLYIRAKNFFAEK